MNGDCDVWGMGEMREEEAGFGKLIKIYALSPHVHFSVVLLHTNTHMALCCSDLFFFAYCLLFLKSHKNPTNTRSNKGKTQCVTCWFNLPPLYPQLTLDHAAAATQSNYKF